MKNPVIEDVASNSLEEKSVESGSGKVVTSKKVNILQKDVNQKVIKCVFYRMIAK